MFFTKNDQFINLTQENKGLRHSLGDMHERCRFLKKALLVKEKQLSLKKRISKEWLDTKEGNHFIALLGAGTVSQGMWVKELMFELAHEKLQASLDLETFFEEANA